MEYAHTRRTAMKICPKCKKKYTNIGLVIHMARAHNIHPVHEEAGAGVGAEAEREVNPVGGLWAVEAKMVFEDSNLIELPIKEAEDEYPDIPELHKPIVSRWSP
jgi:hypothetical protein